ncbi:MAG: lipopolysaccharide biosynthesis glycosyltransferase [Woeseiaceae bacterium]|jgi:lipopolysaccharide biosynthesis glycosyltransferase
MVIRSTTRAFELPILTEIPTSKRLLAPMRQIIEIASAADERYAMPLAAMLVSIQIHMDSNTLVIANLMSVGISEESRRKIESSVDPNRITIRWIHIDETTLRSLCLVLRAEDHISLASYARLLIPDLISADTRRIIYLDSDLIFSDSINHLWTEDLCGHAILAVEESVTSGASAGAIGGIRAYRELRLPGDFPLFNSGVMVFDLSQWREQQLARQAFTYLRIAQDYVRWHDQEAINIVVRGNWKSLSKRWNHSTFQVATKKTTNSNQRPTHRGIIHYNSEAKPWLSSYQLGFGDVFFEALDRTAWSGWRPATQNFEWSVNIGHRISKALTKRLSEFQRLRTLRRKKRFGLAAITNIDSSWPEARSASKAEIRAFCAIDVLLDSHSSHFHSLLADGVDRIFIAISSRQNDIDATINEDPRIVFVDGGDNSQGMLVRRLLHKYGVGHWCFIAGEGESVCAPELGLETIAQVCRYLDEKGFDALPCCPLDRYSDNRGQIIIEAIQQDTVIGKLISAPALIGRCDEPSPRPIQYLSRTPLFRYETTTLIAPGHVIVGASNPAKFFGTIKIL